MDDQQQLAQQSITPQIAEKSFLDRHGISPVLFAYFTLVLIFILYQLIGGLAAAFFILTGSDGVKDVTGMRLATMGAQVLFVMAPTFLLTRLADRRPSQYLRINSSRVATFALPLIGILSLQQVLQVYLIVQEKIPLPPQLDSWLEEFKRMIEEAYRLLVESSTVPELLFVILVVAVVPAIAEEFLFRGLVQRTFERSLGALRGLLLTALIFALFHLNPFSFLPLFVLGLYLGYIVYRANSIWVGVAAHFYNNLFACVAIYFKMGEDLLIAGPADTLSAGSLALTFGLSALVFVLSTYYFVVVTRTQPSTISF